MGTRKPPKTYTINLLFIKWNTMNQILKNEHFLKHPLFLASIVGCYFLKKIYIILLGGGFNPGMAGIAEDSLLPNKNEAFNEDIEDLEEEVRR